MKIPKHAKRVFKGVIFDIYQWPQKMYDGNIKTFEATKQKDGILIIPTIGDKIVIQKQRQPGTNWYYTVPGGRLDVPKENPRQTALRELLEETGMKPKNIRLWKKIQNPSYIIRNLYIFVANDCKKVTELELDGGEKVSLELLTFDQFLKLSDHPSFFRDQFMILMLEARLNPKIKAKFKKAIFG